jgi:hypothetical protein
MADRAAGIMPAAFKDSLTMISRGVIPFVARESQARAL